jgi:hypothetical protein
LALKRSTNAPRFLKDFNLNLYSRSRSVQYKADVAGGLLQEYFAKLLTYFAVTTRLEIYLRVFFFFFYLINLDMFREAQRKEMNIFYYGSTI